MTGSQASDSALAQVIADALALRVADALSSRLEPKLTRIEGQLGFLAWRDPGQLRMESPAREPPMSFSSSPSNPRIMRQRTSGLSSMIAPEFPQTVEQSPRTLYASLPMESDSEQISRPVESDTEQISELVCWAQRACLGCCQGRETQEAVEPEPTGVLADIVTSDAFNIATLLVIVLNTTFVWYVADYTAARAEPGAPWMHVVQWIFLCFYIVEVSLRAVVHGRWFLFNKDWAWNAFDVVLVGGAVVQWVLEEHVIERVQAVHLTFLRLIRLLKLWHFAKRFKCSEYLKEFRRMACVLRDSALPLLYTITIFMITMTIVAFYIVAGVTHFRMQGEADCDGLCQQFPNLFGSVRSACVTLLACTTGGLDWIEVYRVIELTGWRNCILFMVYIIFFNFGLTPIVMGVFVDKILKLATLREREREESEFVTRLTQLLEEIGHDEYGEISLSDLKGLMRDDSMRREFEKLGLRGRELTVFFKTMCVFKQCEKLGIGDFVASCWKMRGPASAMDIQAIGLNVQRIAASLDAAPLDPTGL